MVSLNNTYDMMGLALTTNMAIIQLIELELFFYLLSIIFQAHLNSCSGIVNNDSGSSL